jgi:hypothetical protein
MEEAEAIKVAQRTAKEIFGIPQEETKKKVSKAHWPRTRSRSSGIYHLCRLCFERCVWATGAEKGPGGGHGALVGALSRAGLCSVTVRGRER